MLIRFSYLFLIVALAIGAVLFVYFTRDTAAETPRYVGVCRCAACHEASTAGAQYDRWRHGPHARAFQALSTDSARAYLQHTGDSIASCVSCHTTLGRRAYSAAEERLNAEGVGCERCHGPGSRYAFYEPMTERTAFVDRGGVVGDLEDCTGCHARHVNDTSRVVCPFQRRNFAPDTAWTLISHPTPPGSHQPDTALDIHPDAH